MRSPTQRSISLSRSSIPGDQTLSPSSSCISFLDSQQANFLQVSCSNTPTPLIKPCKLQVPLFPQTILFPHKLRGIQKHMLRLHREDQKVSYHPPSGAPHSLDTPYWGKTPGPSPTCLIFSSQSAGKIPTGRLLQHPQSID